MVTDLGRVVPRAGRRPAPRSRQPVAQTVVPRRARAGRAAVRRRAVRQHAAARRRLPDRRDPAERGGDRAGDRGSTAPRWRRTSRPSGAAAWRSPTRPGWSGTCEARRRAPIRPWTRRPGRSSTGCSPSASRTWSPTRTPAYAAEYAGVRGGVRSRAARGRSTVTEAVARNLLQADGLQGRVRGRPAAPRPGAARRRCEDAVRPRRPAALPLHPPVLRALGLQRKIALGAVVPAGVPRPAAPRAACAAPALDPFGRTEVRRIERALIDEYRALIERVLSAEPATRGRGRARASCRTWCAATRRSSSATWRATAPGRPRSSPPSRSQRPPRWPRPPVPPRSPAPCPPPTPPTA